MRRLTVPKGNFAFTIPFLSHESFQPALKRRLRDTVLQQKDTCLPFHLPSCQIREAAHSTVKELLFDFKKWEKWWVVDKTQVTCPCAKFQTCPTVDVGQDKHIAAPACVLSNSINSTAILSYSAASTFYQSKSQFHKQFMEMAEKWHKFHRLSFQQHRNIWEELFTEQWTLHEANVRTSQRLDYRTVQGIRQLLKPFVTHCADHRPNHAMVFCPVFYFCSLANVWGDSEIFAESSLTIQETTARFLRFSNQYPLSKYKWAHEKCCSLPYGYVLLKEKKQYRTGRPIISYANMYIHRLLKALAVVLSEILMCTWPQAIGNEKIPQIWKALRQFLDQCPVEERLFAANDDLVGFFTSIPSDRIMQATQSLLQEYCSMSGQSPEVGVISINCRSSMKYFRLYTGQVPNLRRFHHRSFKIADIVPLVECCFKLSHFTALGKFGLRLREHLWETQLRQCCPQLQLREWNSRGSIHIASG